jgi:hypothetical protein
MKPAYCPVAAAAWPGYSLEQFAPVDEVLRQISGHLLNPVAGIKQWQALNSCMRRWKYRRAKKTAIKSIKGSQR